jgi:hypothetical protein
LIPGKRIAAAGEAEAAARAPVGEDVGAHRLAEA